MIRSAAVAHSGSFRLSLAEGLPRAGGLEELWTRRHVAVLMERKPGVRYHHGQAAPRVDGALIHRSKVIRQFLSEGAAARIHLERFPGYAPVLDPEEGVWRYLKRVEMRNLCCRDLPETRRELRAACQRLRQKPQIIRNCLQHSGLV